MVMFSISREYSFLLCLVKGRYGDAGRDMRIGESVGLREKKRTSGVR
jgi:hypothetical protein